MVTLYCYFDHLALKSQTFSDCMSDPWISSWTMNFYAYDNSSFGKPDQILASARKLTLTKWT